MKVRWRHAFLKSIVSIGGIKVAIIKSAILTTVFAP